MKNIDTIRATKSIEPPATVATATSAVTSVALRGSLAAPWPAARKRLSARLGEAESPPSACSVRGATRIEPIAEESVAQPRPIGMIGPQSAMRAMTSWSLARISAGAENASLNTTAT